MTVESLKKPVRVHKNKKAKKGCKVKIQAVVEEAPTGSDGWETESIEEIDCSEPMTKDYVEAFIKSKAMAPPTPPPKGQKAIVNEDDWESYSSADDGNDRVYSCPDNLGKIIKIY